MGRAHPPPTVEMARPWTKSPSSMPIPGHRPKLPLWGLLRAGRIRVVVASVMNVPDATGPVEKKLPKEKY